MDKILTVNDVATILQVKAITVREMFREKRLRGFKVGKAWRTTESMLQEDIDALARGEAPAELPTPTAKMGVGQNVKESAGDGPGPNGDKKVSVAPQSASNPPRHETDETSKATKKAAAKKPASPAPSEGTGSVEGKDEDTQQLLF